MYIGYGKRNLERGYKNESTKYQRGKCKNRAREW